MSGVGLSPTEFLWDLGKVDPGAYRIEVRPLGFVSDAWVQPGQITLAALEVPQLSQTRVRFVDAGTGIGAPVVVGSALALSTSHDLKFRPLVNWRLKTEVAGMLEYHGVPTQVTLEIQNATHGTFSYTLDAKAGHHELTVPMHPASWIDIRFRRESLESDSRCKWYGNVDVSSGGEPIKPLWWESQVEQGGGRLISLCVPGFEAIDLKFTPDPGFSELPTYRLESGSPNPRDPMSSRRREVIILVPDADEQGR